MRLTDPLNFQRGRRLKVIGTRPRRIVLSVVAGALTVSLLAGAAPVQERFAQATSSARIEIADDPSTQRKVTNRRHRAIAMVTGLDISLASLIASEAERYGIDDKVLVGVIAHETGKTFNPSLIATNTNGSRDFGLMQLNSGTYPWLSRRLNLVNADPLDPTQNIQMGVWYLDQLLTECKDDLLCALGRYNGDSTGRYASFVNRVIDRYGELLREALEKIGREQHRPQPRYGRAA